jgi:5'-nucleotidase
MPEIPADPRPSRILITNDDGISAPGLKLLEEFAHSICGDVWVCAPETEQSSCSHSLTLTRPVRLKQYGPRRFSVDGTPTDCVLLAAFHLLKDKRPDLLLSGINAGRNLADDVTYSGTVAAALEATMIGIPSIAFSQGFNDYKTPIDWSAAETHLPSVMEKLCGMTIPDGVLLNVNFPAVEAAGVTGIRMVRQGRHKIGDGLAERRDQFGRPYFWVGAVISDDSAIDPDSDLGVVLGGGISITPLSLDLTHDETLRALRKEFA